MEGIERGNPGRGCRGAASRALASTFPPPAELLAAPRVRRLGSQTGNPSGLPAVLQLEAVALYLTQIVILGVPQAYSIGLLLKALPGHSSVRSQFTPRLLHNLAHTEMPSYVSVACRLYAIRWDLCFQLFNQYYLYLHHPHVVQLGFFFFLYHHQLITHILSLPLHHSPLILSCG